MLKKYLFDRYTLKRFFIDSSHKTHEFAHPLIFHNICMRNSYIEIFIGCCRIHILHLSWFVVQKYGILCCLKLTRKYGWAILATENLVHAVFMSKDSFETFYWYNHFDHTKMKILLYSIMYMNKLSLLKFRTVNE